MLTHYYRNPALILLLAVIQSKGHPRYSQQVYEINVASQLVKAHTFFFIQIIHSKP